MTSRNRTLATGILAGALATVLVAAAIGLVVVYTGAYNVAATEEHTALARWALGTTMHQSIERRAGAVDVPASLEDGAAADGAEAYKAMCQHCHGGPGVERAEWASGMKPRPPYLAEAANEWAPAEVFWLLKHGVRMSGMPAFGPTHDDAALWEIVGFVKRLPAMTAQRYASLGDAGGHADDAREPNPKAHR